MTDYVDDRADIRAYLQQQSRDLSPPLSAALIERVVTQPEPPVFFTVAQRLRRLEDPTLPQAEQAALRTDPALWVVPAEELIQTEALRVVTEAEARGISETQVWHTLGVLTVAGEHLSEEHLEALGLWQAGITDRILKLAANFFRPRPLGRQPALPYQFDHPGYHREVLRHLNQGDITHLHRLLAQGCERCWCDPRSAARLYALRHRVAHLIAAQDWQEVARAFADADAIVERSERFGFAEVHADALAAAQHPDLPQQWREAFGDWERFLRWRIERLRHYPRAYHQEVCNEFVPYAAQPFANTLKPLCGEVARTSVFLLRKAFGPPALSGLGHGYKVESVAITPDGHWVGSGGWDGTVKVWEVVTGRCVNTLFFDQELGTVAFCAGPSLRLLVADRSGRVFGYEILPLRA